MGETLVTEDKSPQRKHSWIMMVIVSVISIVSVVSIFLISVTLNDILSPAKESEKRFHISSETGPDPVPQINPDEVSDDEEPSSPPVTEKAESMLIPSKEPHITYEVDSPEGEAVIVYNDVESVVKSDTVNKSNWLKIINIDNKKQKRTSGLSVFNKGDGAITCRIKQKSNILVEETTRTPNSVITCHL